MDLMTSNDKEKGEMVKEIHQMAQSTDKLSEETKEEIGEIYERYKDEESLRGEDIKKLVSAVQELKENK